MGLPFFVNSSVLIQRAIYFETAPLFLLSQGVSFLAQISKRCYKCLYSVILMTERALLFKISMQRS